MFHLTLLSSCVWYKAANFTLWDFSLQYLRSRYVAEHFVTQEQTDVQLSGLINKTFLLRLLLLSLFTGYLCKMQNITCMCGDTWGIKDQKEVSDCNVRTQICCSSAGFLLHVPLNFWKSGETFSNEFWWKQMCLRQRQVFREVCFSSVLCLWDCTDNITKDRLTALDTTDLYLSQNRYSARTRQNYLLSLFRNLLCIYLLPVGKSFLHSHLENGCWDRKGIYFECSVKPSGKLQLWCRHLSVWAVLLDWDLKLSYSLWDKSSSSQMITVFYPG